VEVIVSERRSTTESLARHWDAAYAKSGVRGVSWYQADASVSLELFDALGVGPDSAVVDVGGGASVLAERLVARGFSDVSVLDVSAEALAEARSRAGDGSPIRWLHDDLLLWRPERRFDVWHDRAVFHFLVAPADRGRYLETLLAALRPGGAVVLGTFAADGPDHCSGLPVARYSTEDLTELLEADFELVETRREKHVTPAGVMQPLAWVAARLRVA
jgi:trans-aconitate methyltransferase